MTAPHTPAPMDRGASTPERPPLFTDPAILRAAASMFKQSRREIESEVSGTSMGRTIPNKSRIRIRCGVDSEWRNGTVIAFFAGPKLVTHRIVGQGSGRRSRAFWLTRGDGAVACDPPVAADAVLGEVVAWRSGGTWRAVPGPVPASAARRVASKCTEVVTRVALEMHAGFARGVAIGMAKFLRAVRRILPA